MQLNEHTGDHGSQVKGWKCADVMFELHYGLPHALPKHSHSTYQIGTTTRDPGEYHCDGRRWNAPPGSMLVFHPGQVHSAPHPGVRSESDVSRIIFVHPAKLQAVASELRGRAVPEPRFDDIVLHNKSFIAQFCQLHDLVTMQGSTLETESCLLAVLSRMVSEFASQRIDLAPGRGDRTKTRVVRDYVESNYSENMSLNELAEVACVSPFHLSRTFAHDVGMPPHAFQTQVRVDRAKPLLLQGMPVAEVAVRTGFFDQSHFTRHFRRIVGVPPRSYVLAAR
jgi:AraC-like DNA-binding protein